MKKRNGGENYNMVLIFMKDENADKLNDIFGIVRFMNFSDSFCCDCYLNGQKRKLFVILKCTIHAM